MRDDPRSVVTPTTPCRSGDPFPHHVLAIAEELLARGAPYSVVRAAQLDDGASRGGRIAPVVESSDHAHR